jgi:hypothetical protein
MPPLLDSQIVEYLKLIHATENDLPKGSLSRSDRIFQTKWFYFPEYSGQILIGNPVIILGYLTITREPLIKETLESRVNISLTQLTYTSQNPTNPLRELAFTEFENPEGSLEQWKKVEKLQQRETFQRVAESLEYDDAEDLTAHLFIN